SARWGVPGCDARLRRALGAASGAERSPVGAASNFGLDSVVARAVSGLDGDQRLRNVGRAPPPLAGSGHAPASPPPRSLPARARQMVALRGADPRHRSPAAPPSRRRVDPRPLRRPLRERTLSVAGGCLGGERLE